MNKIILAFITWQYFIDSYQLSVILAHQTLTVFTRITVNKRIFSCKSLHILLVRKFYFCSRTKDTYRHYEKKITQNIFLRKLPDNILFPRANCQFFSHKQTHTVTTRNIVKKLFLTFITWHISLDRTNSRTTLSYQNYMEKIKQNITYIQ